MIGRWSGLADAGRSNLGEHLAGRSFLHRIPVRMTPAAIGSNLDSDLTDEGLAE